MNASKRMRRSDFLKALSAMGAAGLGYVAAARGNPPSWAHNNKTATSTTTTATSTTASTTTAAAPSSAKLSDWYPGSAFAAPIPSNPTLHPSSSTIINSIWTPQGTNYYEQYWLGPRGGPRLGAAPAVAYPSASTPTVTVQINYPKVADHFVQVPIPPGFDVGDTSHSENKASLMMVDGTVWDFYDITPPGVATFDYMNEAGYPGNAGNQYWQALNGWHHTAGWTGSQVTPGYPWSDSNIEHPVGIIRQHDILNTPTGGNWGHALALTFTGNTTGANGWPRAVFPATSGDGKNAGAYATPMGTRFQLLPSINVDTWASTATKPEWLKQLCRTLQVYGTITAHSALLPQGNGDGFWTEWYGNLGGWFFPWQDQTTGDVPSYYDASMNVPPDLLPYFRVLDWNAHWPGGNP